VDDEVASGHGGRVVEDGSVVKVLLALTGGPLMTVHGAALPCAVGRDSLVEPAVSVVGRGVQVEGPDVGVRGLAVAEGAVVRE